VLPLGRARALRRAQQGKGEARGERAEERRVFDKVALRLPVFITNINIIIITRPLSRPTEPPKIPTPPKTTNTRPRSR
jgi:hypothetical protein